MSFEFSGIITALPLLAHWVVTIGLALRITIRRRPTSSALAWIILIAALPVVGIALYLLVGELWLSAPRIRIAERVRRRFRPMFERMPRCNEADWSDQRPRFRHLSELAYNETGYPAQPGNSIELLDDADETLVQIASAIDASQQYCHLLYYLWGPGGRADDVALALERAAKRGVICRVLVDAVGGRAFFESHWPARLREAGVHVASALPVGVFRRSLARVDIRNHRKIAVIDGDVAFTGSQNLADPKAFMYKSSVGEWVDLSFALRGPAVKAMELTFRADWAQETGHVIDDDPSDRAAAGALSDGEGSIVQVVPCGPDRSTRVLRDLTIAAIYSARHEVIITTPYFVPDDAMLTALTSIARRGVRVRLIIPEKADHPLVRWAARAYYSDLLDSGVAVELHSGGLLHAKSLTVDSSLSLIGSANMDMRSFLINLEITMLVYGHEFASDLRERQLAYAAQSRPIDREFWRARSRADRFLANGASVIAPLL